MLRAAAAAACLFAPAWAQQTVTIGYTSFEEPAGLQPEDLAALTWSTAGVSECVGHLGRGVLQAPGRGRPVARRNGAARTGCFCALRRA